MFCPNCGCPIEDENALFCNECGENLHLHTVDNVSSGILNSNIIEKIVDEQSEIIKPSKTLSGGFFTSLSVFLKEQSFKKAGIIISCIVLILAMGIGLVIVFHNNSSNSLIDDSLSYKTEDDSSVDKKKLIASSDKFVDNYSPISYTWLINPKIKATDITMVIRSRPIIKNSIVDYNSIGSYYYDRAAVIREGNKYGLIAYNGLSLCNVMFNSIEIGYNSKYILQNNSDDIFYTVNKRYEQVKLKSYDDVLKITGTAPNERVVWVDSEQALFAEGSGKITNYDLACAVLYGGSDCRINNGRLEKGFSENGYILVKNGSSIKDIVFTDVGNFSCGVIPVKLNGKWGYVDENCEIVLPFEFDEIDYGTGYSQAYNASDNLIVVRKDGKFALYDLDGTRLIDFGVFEQMRPAYNGMLWVKANGKWGVISVRDGAHDITPQTPIYYGSGYKAKVNSSNGLRLREKPDTSSKVLGILSNHKEITVLDYDKDWLFVWIRDDVYGWVKEEYVVS